MSPCVRAGIAGQVPPFGQFPVGERTFETGALDLSCGLHPLASGLARLVQAVAGQLVIVHAGYLAVDVDAGLLRSRIEIRFW
jgi:hypothetical protein